MSRCCARALGASLLVGLVALSLGCGSGTKPRAMVKGKVSIGEKNLTFGNVQFHGANNVMANGTINKEGIYEIPDAPIGDVKVAIIVPKVNPVHLAKMRAMRKGMPEMKSVDPSGSGNAIPIMGDMPDNIVPIPDKYGDPQTSGLTYTVQNGDQTKDFVLAP